MAEAHVCPWQAGNLLAVSARKLIHNPERILGPYLSKGMTVLDIGPGMGFFTIPMADIVGNNGKVIAADLQPEMLRGLLAKARKAGVGNRVIPKQCGPRSLNITGVNGTVDFALLMMMLHEVPDSERLVSEVYNALKPGGKLLFAEPIVHVGRASYQNSLKIMKRAGFSPVKSPRIAFCWAVLLGKGSKT